MKIDGGGVEAGQLGTDWSIRSFTTAMATTAQSQSRDRTTLSSNSSTVQNLVAQALATPDVRQDKVNALRQAMNNGSYQVDSQKLASAMMSDS